MTQTESLWVEGQARASTCSSPWGLQDITQVSCRAHSTGNKTRLLTENKNAHGLFPNPSNTLSLKLERRQLSHYLASAFLSNCRENPQPKAQAFPNPSKCEEICGEKRGLPAEVSTKLQTKPSPPPLLLPNTHKMPFHLCHSQQLYIQKHLAQMGRKEEKKEKRETLSIRMGWQYHCKPRESTSILAGFRSLWLFQHQ